MTFYEALQQWLVDTENMDRDALMAQAIHIQFATIELRLWGGYGKAYTPDGETWLGWEDGEGGSFIQYPNVADIRDGTSELIPITLGYINEVTYRALIEDPEEYVERTLTLYSLFFDKPGSTRTNVPPGDGDRFHIKDTSFRQEASRNDDGQIIQRYSVTVHMKNINEGRSQSFFGAYTSTQQRGRSELFHDLSNDAYADFTPALAQGIPINLDQ